MVGKTLDCQSCRHKNSEGRRFCGKCGAALPNVCQACGFLNQFDDKFCGGCGKSFAGEVGSLDSIPRENRLKAEPAISDGERRYATVLFSDLSGYTSLNDLMDPEQVMGIMNRIKVDAVKIVESCGGIVSQFVGDEVLALFGIPVAHEDDPRRAVNAAFLLHKLVRDMSPENVAKHGQLLRMHTGIHSGLVVTNTRDVRDGTIGVTGDTVNTAARLRALAKDDQILVSSKTRRMIAPYYRSEKLEPVTVKGKRQRIFPFQVIGESGVQSRFDAAEQRGLTTFAGRQDELATLNRCLKNAVAGHGQFVTVSGEAGVGKSRALHEFEKRIDREMVTVIRGYCQAEGVATPYLPFVDVLRRVIHLDEGDSPQEMRKNVTASLQSIDPALSKYLPCYLHLLSIAGPEHAQLAELSGDALRRQLQEALAAIITQSAARRPIVVMLEDWHWADEASDAALRYLLGLIALHRVAVLVTHRREYLDRWSGIRSHTALPLVAMDANESVQMIRTIFAVERIPGGLGELIHERTGGNPFFVEELCRDLLDEGTVVVSSDHVAVVSSLEKVSLPMTVQAVIQSRVDRLNERDRKALRLASVIGREFSLRLLEKVYAGNPALAPLLESLKEQGLIEQVGVLPDVTYQFRHVLTQAVVYDAMLLERRRELHGRIAHALEELFTGRLEEHYERLAYHFKKSTSTNKAIKYLELAGGKAARAFSFVEARQHYRDAVFVLAGSSAGPEIRRKQVEMTIRWAVVSQAHPSRELLLALEQASEIAQSLRDIHLLISVTLNVGWQHTQAGGHDEAMTALGEALRLALETRDQRMAAMTTARIGWTCFHAAEDVKGARYLRRAISMLKGQGDLVQTSYCYGYLAKLLGRRGRFAKAFVHAEKASRFGNEAGNAVCQIFANGCIAELHLQRGDFRRVIEIVPKFLGAATNLGYTDMITWGLMNSGYATFMLGSQEEGLALMSRGIETFEAPWSRFSYYSLWLGLLAHACSVMGSQGKAKDYAQQAISDVSRATHGKIYALWALAKLAANEIGGNWLDAEQYSLESIELAAELGARPLLAQSHLHFAEILQEKEDVAGSRDQLDLATNLCGKLRMVWWLERAEAVRASLMAS